MYNYYYIRFQSLIALYCLHSLPIRTHALLFTLAAKQDSRFTVYISCQSGIRTHALPFTLAANLESGLTLYRLH